MAITEEERNEIKQEVDDALERTTIDKGNLDVYFKTSNRGKVVAWMPLMCKNCGKPKYVHEFPECGIRVRMPKAKASLYISAITNNESVKQEMEWAILEFRHSISTKRRSTFRYGRRVGPGRPTKGTSSIIWRRRQGSQ